MTQLNSGKIWFSGGGKHYDRMQRLEDEVRLTRNESKGMMEKMTGMMATGVKTEESRRSPVEPRRAPPSRSAPKGASPASRAGNSRQFDVQRDLGEHVGDRVRRALPVEVDPERQPGRGANSAGGSNPNETSQNNRNV